MVIPIIAFTLSLSIGLILYPIFITWLKDSNLKQKVSEYALDDFKDKAQTPTFGGLLFVVLPAVITILFNRSPMVLLVTFIYVAYGFLGLVDDYKIIKEGKNDGLSAKFKFAMQLLIALVFYLIYLRIGGDSSLKIPFIAEPIQLNFGYLFLVIFMLSGSSNAVNLTDGMDGLAGGTVLIALATLSWFAYGQQAWGILTLMMSVMGSLLVFIIFNKKPAQIFMGDVGSLSLGALLALVSIILKKELLFAVVGGVFVWETLTVIIQQLSVRIFKRRVFKYTPIHYSFTLSGWKEEKVVYLFYMIGLGFSALAIILVSL